MKVAQLLHAQDYSLQGNRKTEEGADHPDRDAQFRHINATVRQALAARRPGHLGGHEEEGTGRQLREQRPPVAPGQAAADRVNGHDFPSRTCPAPIPYGIYDLGRNTGFVNVGTDHDTAAFAVASIRGWWRARGPTAVSRAREPLSITADGGGSNGYSPAPVEAGTAAFADETGRSLSVCHFPPGTSKWNKVEHRLFSFISSNWRGEPLRDYETIVHLIARTTTAKGLKVTCRLDRRKYRTGREVSDAEMQTLNLERDRFHGDWNYVIRPRDTNMPNRLS